MIKFYNMQEAFQEVPDELSLAFNITNCQIHCPGCHSPMLQEDTGTPLTERLLENILLNKRGISCVLFMGSGNKEYEDLNSLASLARFLGFKTAVYLGEDEIPQELNIGLFNYIKIGHYDASLGGLDNPSTNQRFYKVENQEDGSYHIRDYTYKFNKIKTTNES